MATFRFCQKRFRCAAIGFTALLILSAGLGRGFIQRTDQKMREELLRQTRVTAQAVNLERLKKLSGTERDLMHPDYLRIKEQLAAIRSADARCRFIYLMGRNAAGRIFFFADDVPAGSPDESPAGMIYDDAPEFFHQVFDSGTSGVVGPFPDQWGTFVSGAIPLIDPESGKIMAVLGMDFDARRWSQDVALGSALPIGLILMLVILITATLISASTEKTKEAAPVLKHRLVIPVTLATILILLVLVGGLWFYRGQKNMIQQEVEKQLTAVTLLKANQITAWRNDQLKDIRLLAENPYFRQTATRLLRETESGSDPSFVSFIQLFKENNEYEDILLVDTEGRIRLSLGEFDRGIQIGTNDLKNALSANKPVFIDLHINESVQKFFVGVVAPLSNEGARCGAVVLLLDAGHFLDPVLKIWPTFSKTAESLLVKRDGDQVFFLSDLRHQPGSALKFRMSLRETNRPAVQAVLGNTGVVYGKDYRNMDVVAISQPIPDSEWVLFSKIDQQEAFAHWKNHSDVIVGLMVCLIVIAGALGLFLWRYGEKHYSEELDKSTRALSNKNIEMLAITESVHDAIVIRNTEGRITYWNPAAEAIFGYSFTEAVGQNFSRLLHPDENWPGVQEVEQHLDDGSTKQVEIPCIHKNGNEIFVSLSLSNVLLGEIPHTVAIARDVTEHKQMEVYHEIENSVLQTLNRPVSLREALDNILTEIRIKSGIDAAAIRLQDGEDFPYFAHQGFSAEFLTSENSLFDCGPDGKPCRNASGNVCLQCTCGLVISGKTDAAHPLFTRGGSFWVNDAFPLVNLPPEQDPRLHPRNVCMHHGYASLALIPIRTHEKIIGLLQLNGREKGCFSLPAVEHLESIASHIGEAVMRKQAEDALVEANLQLKAATDRADAANAAKSIFLSNMSHEIRTPMNAVIGMTELLLETPLTPEQQEFTHIVRISGETLVSLINDILDFSKIEAGHMEIENQNFDLIQCVEDSIDMMTVRAAEKKIELTCKIDSEVPPVVCGDSARLRQILLNLLSNALKFTHEGEVGVSVSAERQGETCRIAFSVRDTGIGIPADRIETIFEAFTQADLSTTRKYGGTGLGLTISRRLSELMGGTMRAESTPGKGSVFHFTVQVTVPPDASVARTGQIPFSMNNLDVLIVDDNQSNLQILAAHLTRWGLKPTAFSDPVAALQSIRDGRNYSLVITDMQMPVMDGDRLVREIRNHRAAETPPIIMLTSLGNRNLDQPLDLAAYLVKPVKSSVLYQHIESVLNRDARALPEQSATPEQPEPVSHLNLLVVEDNLLNQKVALRMLSKLGYHADLAIDGVDALKKIEGKNYDIVLMDIQMPRMDGLAATREIHLRFAGRPRPIIIGMTAHAAVEERNKGLEAGMDEYLTKPIQMTKLGELLREVRNNPLRDKAAT